VLDLAALDAPAAAGSSYQTVPVPELELAPEPGPAASADSLGPESPGLRRHDDAVAKKSKTVDSLILRIPDLTFMRSKILLFPASAVDN
jgi:hypothetical protein